MAARARGRPGDRPLGHQVWRPVRPRLHGRQEALLRPPGDERHLLQGRRHPRPCLPPQRAPPALRPARPVGRHRGHLRRRGARPHAPVLNSPPLPLRRVQIRLGGLQPGRPEAVHGDAAPHLPLSHAPPPPPRQLEPRPSSRVMDPSKLLPRLLASCPSLADLTLEQCPTIVDLEVPSLSLWNFSMLCCHNAKAVSLHTTRLQSLRFKGGLGTVFQIANHRGIRALTIELCEELSSKSPREIAPVTTLIGRCSNLDYLHLSLRPSIAYYSSMFTGVLRELRRLSLEGCLLTAHGVKSVAALLANAHNLEELSLFPLAPLSPKNEQRHDGYDTDYGGSDSDTEEEDGGGIGTGTGAVNNGGTRMPDCLWRMHVGCLNRKVRRIGLWNYQGQPLDRMLARFLLSKAAVLEEFSVRLAAEGVPRKDEIAKELGYWPWNRHTTVTCSK